MIFRETSWDELDTVWSIPDDAPKPEGAEISEHDFDRIMEGADEDDE